MKVFIIFITLMICFVFNTKFLSASGFEDLLPLRNRSLTLNEAGFIFYTMQKICGIYKITSPSKRIYIGQSIDILKRWKKYYVFDCKGQDILLRSLKKYGAIKHNFEIICQCDKNELDKLENYYIELFNTFNSGFGMNLKNGGHNSKYSLQSRMKMRNSQLGKTKSDITKAKMSIARKGKITKKSKIVIYKDKKYSLINLCREFGIENKYYLVKVRIRNGWQIEDAINMLKGYRK